MSSQSYDVIVIGGGPAGSTVSSLIAQRGHRVLLLERHQFPRHQIGESLLPSTVHGICRLLGVDGALDRAGFLKKRGGTFLWGSSPVPWTFAFSKMANSPSAYAFQVERAKFDKILLDNATRLGVTVIEQACVRDVLFADDVVTGVSYDDAGGRSHVVQANYVVDAGGHQSPFHRLVGRRLYSKFFQNVALYGYFRNGKRLPAPNAGNILCAAFPGGWFWYIPLSDELTSVGVVVAKSLAGRIGQGQERAFQGFVAECPLIAEYLRDASRVTDGMYGEWRVRSDYSYCNTAFHAKRLLLIGDAACFVDPVLSSGVHLATYGGLLAARALNTCLDRAVEATAPDERECFDEFEFRYRREYGTFYEFLAAFYDMHRDEHSYFWSARKVLQSTQDPEEAFVRLVAGHAEHDASIAPFDSGLADPTRSGLGSWMESFLTGAAGDGQPPAGGREIQAFDFDNFMPGISTEMAQIQSQAFLGRIRRPESPLKDGGLIPSEDGLAWRRAMPSSGTRMPASVVPA